MFSFVSDPENAPETVPAVFPADPARRSGSILSSPPAGRHGGVPDTDSITLGDQGTRSNQRSVRRVPILPPDRIRTLPFGTGITLLRSAPPIVTDLRPWPHRPDAAQLRSDRDELEALLRRPS